MKIIILQNVIVKRELVVGTMKRGRKENMEIKYINEQVEPLETTVQ